MKWYRWFVLLIVLLSLSPVRAQTNLSSDRTFHTGIILGANFATLKGDLYDGYRKLGWHTGITSFIKIRSLATVNLELLYTQKGCRGVREINSSYVGPMFEKYFVDLNYIEVPLQVYFQATPLISLGGGFAYGRLLSSREDIQTDQPYYIDNALYRFRDDEWSYILGAQFEFRKRYMIALRYQRSLTTVRGYFEAPPGLATGMQYNDHFTLRLAYMLL